MKYEQVIDGEWWQIGDGRSNRRQRQVCCHCLLIHDWHFRVNPDGTISAMINVNTKATYAARRRHGILNVVKVLMDWWKEKNAKAS
jgi:hypothetical protein